MSNLQKFQFYIYIYISRLIYAACVTSDERRKERSVKSWLALQRIETTRMERSNSAKVLLLLALLVGQRASTVSTVSGHRNLFKASTLKRGYAMIEQCRRTFIQLSINSSVYWIESRLIIVGMSEFNGRVVTWDIEARMAGLISSSIVCGYASNFRIIAGKSFSRF